MDKFRSGRITRILYCTTGVLLQRFITSSANLNTHIILDEVHERTADMDMLLLILKKQIMSNNMKSKIILMSATFDVKLLQNYFTFSKLSFNIVPSLIDINSQQFKDTDFIEYSREFLYLEDILQRIKLRKPFDFSNNLDNEIQYDTYDDFLFDNNDDYIIFDPSWPIMHKVLCELIIDILLHFVEMPHSGLFYF